MTYSVAVVGASGFAGGELLRYLLAHPHFRLDHLCASASAGQSLEHVHPHLPQLAGRVLEPTRPEVLVGCDIVFFALPHGASGEIAQAIEDAGGRGIFIDCGADHRLRSAEEWQRYYSNDWAGAWDYGMPELLHAGESRARVQREILGASARIAVPGCNVSAVTLGIQPALARGLVDPGSLCATLAVGYSGAGKVMKPHLMASAALGSAQPYAVGGSHRHIPEIIQNLQALGDDEVALTFTPVLVPLSRGILATTVARVRDGVSEADVAEAYACYEDEPLIHVCAPGTWPTTGVVTGSARCTVGLSIDERARTLVAISALDNLGKGTAAAAVQSANLACGLDETCGLSTEGVAP